MVCSWKKNKHILFDSILYVDLRRTCVVKCVAVVSVVLVSSRQDDALTTSLQIKATSPTTRISPPI
jgi:hypothetical protein